MLSNMIYLFLLSLLFDWSVVGLQIILNKSIFINIYLNISIYTHNWSDLCHRLRDKLGERVIPHPHPPHHFEQWCIEYIFVPLLFLITDQLLARGSVGSYSWIMFIIKYSARCVSLIKFSFFILLKSFHVVYLALIHGLYTSNDTNIFYQIYIKQNALWTHHP